MPPAHTQLPTPTCGRYKPPFIKAKSRKRDERGAPCFFPLQGVGHDYSNRHSRAWHSRKQSRLTCAAEGKGQEGRKRADDNTRNGGARCHRHSRSRTD